MTDQPLRTKSGKTLHDGDLDAIADEVATTDFDVNDLENRRRGRPLLWSAHPPRDASGNVD